MSANSYGLGILFSARDLASKKVRELERNFKKLDETTERQQANFKKAMANTVKGAAMIGAGAVALRGSLKLASAAGEFEQGLARVAVITQASAEDMAKLEDAATKAGIATQFSPTEAVDGLRSLAAMGFDADQSISALTPSLDLAAGGMISVEQASSTVSSALKAFGHDVSESTIVADRLMRITQLTALQAEDLQLALGTVARGASAANQKLTEMLPAMGLVKNTGVDTSVAASSVSSALLFMAKNADAFKKVGVSVTDAKGKFRPFLDVILDFKAKTAGMTNDAKKAALTTKLFGRFGVTAVTAISKQLDSGIKGTNGQLLHGKAAVDQLRSNMENAAGTAKKSTAQILDTFAGQKDLLTGSIATLAIEIGKPIAQVLRPIVEGLIFTINGLRAGFAALPGPIRVVVGALLVLLPALLIIGGTIKLVSGAFVLMKLASAAAAGVAGTGTGVFAGLAASIGTAATAVGSFLLAALPFVIIGAAIAAAAYLIYKNWGAVSKFFIAVGEKVWDWMNKFSEFTIKWVGSLFAGIGSVIGFVWNRLKQFWMDIAGVFKRLIEMGRTVANAVSHAFTVAANVISTVAGAIRSVVDVIVRYIEKIVAHINWVINKAREVGNIAKKPITFIQKHAGNALGAISGAAVPGASSLPSRVRSIAAEAASVRAPQASNGASQRGGTPVNLTINTNVDGEVVATATRKFNTDEGHRNFGAHGEDS